MYEDQSIRFVLERALLGEGLPTRSCTNPREVLAALDIATESDGPQILVSDIRMPGGSGLDLLEKVKKEEEDRKNDKEQKDQEDRRQREESRAREQNRGQSQSP